MWPRSRESRNGVPLYTRFAMPKSEREETISVLTSRIFSAMLNDLMMDVTLQSHHEIARSRTICCICHTLCSSVHTPTPTTLAPQITVSPTRADSPSSVPELKANNGSSGTGTNTPTSVKDGNSYLECVNCSRQVASNRYAPHLSNCMGLASARRGAVRGNVKSKPSLDLGRSVSPASEVGNVSDDNSKGKGKGKSKVKRADEAEFNLKRKRLDSPQVSPHKKQKKQNSSASPVSRVKDVSGVPNSAHYSPSHSQSKVPSKLRESSSASFLERSSLSDSSRSTSRAGTPASSSFSHSPQLSAKNIGTTKSKALAFNPPKRPSPPRPPPLQVLDYTIDAEGGDETGSSTDTDSS